MKRALVMATFLSLLSGLFPTKLEAASYRADETYSEIRAMVLGLNPETIGIKPGRPDEVWGVLMETGYPDAVATLIALADGTVSLYFSNGGGIIGLGFHPGPERAATSLIAASQSYVKLARPANATPLPQPTFTCFYLLTGAGLLAAEAKESDLGSGQHVLSPLFFKAHELMTEIRTVEERHRADPSTSQATRH